MNLSGARWRTSSFSGAQSDCVEVANLGAVRDSKNATGPALLADLAAFLNAVKSGRLNR